MKTMFLIGYFVSGLPFAQAMPEDVCRHVEVSLSQNAIVEAETDIGTRETIRTAVCVEAINHTAGAPISWSTAMTWRSSRLISSI